MAKNGTIAYVTELPECDICKHVGNDSEKASPAIARYDVVTKDGRWAFVCGRHLATHAKHPNELGTGRGQKLEVKA